MNPTPADSTNSTNASRRTRKREETARHLADTAFEYFESCGCTAVTTTARERCAGFWIMLEDLLALAQAALGAIFPMFAPGREG